MRPTTRHLRTTLGAALLAALVPAAPTGAEEAKASRLGDRASIADRWIEDAGAP
jgi:hypothetical protein